MNARTWSCWTFGSAEVRPGGRDRRDRDPGGRGQLSIDPELLREALAAEARDTARVPAVRHVDLTARQLDVLALLAERMTNKEIGGGLAISDETVKKHVQNIIWKLGAADRTQAAIFALRRGLLAALGTPATGGPGSP